MSLIWIFHLHPFKNNLRFSVHVKKRSKVKKLSKMWLVDFTFCTLWIKNFTTSILHFGSDLKLTTVNIFITACSGCNELRVERGNKAPIRNTRNVSLLIALDSPKWINYEHNKCGSLIKNSLLWTKVGNFVPVYMPKNFYSKTNNLFCWNEMNWVHLMINLSLAI